MKTSIMISTFLHHLLENLSILNAMIKGLCTVVQFNIRLNKRLPSTLIYQNNK